MKKILFLLILIITAGIAFALPKNGGTMDDKKILIAYFSWGGNTKYIAEKIQARTGGDMFRIETATPYPSDYNETAYGVAKKQHEEGVLPELKDNGDVSAYDVVFVGTPAWWYEMAPAVKTFLSKNDFEGKIVVPFITHGGGGQYTIASDMAKFAKGAKVLAPLVVYERGNSETEGEIAAWIKKLQ